VTLRVSSTAADAESEGKLRGAERTRTRGMFISHVTSATDLLGSVPRGISRRMGCSVRGLRAHIFAFYPQADILVIVEKGVWMWVILAFPEPLSCGWEIRLRKRCDDRRHTSVLPRITPLKVIEPSTGTNVDTKESHEPD